MNVFNHLMLTNGGKYQVHLRQKLVNPLMLFVDSHCRTVTDQQTIQGWLTAPLVVCLSTGSEAEVPGIYFPHFTTVYATNFMQLRFQCNEDI